MTDAREFRVGETLKNGVAITIRAIRPADKARLAETFGRLAPGTVYTRFFQARQSLSEGELRAATEVDFETVVALVVTTGFGENETIIAGGRYLTMDPSITPRCAEIAFLVREDFHGQGIAGRILRHLIRIAREKGVRQFEAAVLPENKAMLAVFARCGLPRKEHAKDGVIHVSLSLAPAPEAA